MSGGVFNEGLHVSRCNATTWTGRQRDEMGDPQLSQHTVLYHRSLAVSFQRGTTETAMSSPSIVHS